MQVVKALVPAIVCLSVCGFSTGDNPLEVKTKSGKVKGHTESTSLGKDVDAFLGIPYAAAADGKYRFAPPREVEHWDGVLDATKLPNPCYQIVKPKWRDTEYISKQKEVENCLKLNIWVPKPRPKKCAVMVWIHGGGFASGSSDLPLYTGAKITAQENVIVVSMNYRLSGFGFLYLGHPLAPGNAGLMDQALAMKWVKNNIKAFGGDPNRITIFGESAGAGSVGLHLLAPRNLDVFNNAILQSGSAASFWATASNEEALEQALKLAGKVGCPTNIDQRDDIVQCLQDVSSNKLADAIISIDETTSMTFRPTVDGKFLPDHPSKLLKEGKFCGETNILIGYTKEDGSFVLPIFSEEMALSEDTLYTEEQIRHFMSALTFNMKKIDGLPLDLVKYTYTDWESHPHDRVTARAKLIEYLTDRWFACGALKTANKFSEKGNKVFFYRFDHIPEKQLMPFKIPKWMGSSHADELEFMLGHALTYNNEEAKLARQMIRYWANFARHNDPNDEYLPTWPKYNAAEKEMLLIDGKGFKLKKNDRMKECAFWEHVFPNVLNKQKDEL